MIRLYSSSTCAISSWSDKVRSRTLDLLGNASTSPALMTLDFVEPTSLHCFKPPFPLRPSFHMPSLAEERKGAKTSTPSVIDDKCSGSTTSALPTVEFRIMFASWYCSFPRQHVRSSDTRHTLLSVVLPIRLGCHLPWPASHSSSPESLSY